MHAAGVFTARFAELDVERRMSAEGRSGAGIPFVQLVGSNAAQT